MSTLYIGIWLLDVVDSLNQFRVPSAFSLPVCSLLVSILFLFCLLVILHYSQLPQDLGELHVHMVSIGSSKSLITSLASA